MARAKKTAGVTALSVDDLKKMINDPKAFGAGTLRTADDPKFEITRIPTGVLTIDMLLDGGVARGRHTEVHGSESVGKSYLMFCLFASAQSLGLKCCLFDVEGSFDPVWAARLGVDLKELDLGEQKDHGNKLVDVMETLLRSGQYDVIGVDSIAGLLPKAEREKDMEAGSYGTEQAKLMSAALRRLTAANRHNTACYWINQQREAINVTFGKRTTTPGGRAMRHYAGTRLELSRTATLKKPGSHLDHSTGEIKKGEVPFAHRVVAQVQKDKTGIRPLTTTTFVFNYRNARHDPIEDLFYLGRLYGFIKQTGTKWYVVDYKDEAVVGKGSFKSWLRENRAVAEDLEDWIRYGKEDDD